MAREGGWGSLDEEHVGAPFDATAMSMGGFGGGRSGGLGYGSGAGGTLGRAEAQNGVPRSDGHNSQYPV